MHFESQVVIHREPADVRRFPGSVENVVKHCKLQLTSRDGIARFIRDDGGRSELNRIRHEPWSGVVSTSPLSYAKRSAILTDLEFLKRAIDNEPAANPNR